MKTNIPAWIIAICSVMTGTSRILILAMNARDARQARRAKRG